MSSEKDKSESKYKEANKRWLEHYKNVGLVKFLERCYKKEINNGL